MISRVMGNTGFDESMFPLFKVHHKADCSGAFPKGALDTLVFDFRYSVISARFVGYLAVFQIFKAVFLVKTSKEVFVRSQ